ncbi:hypothetical protein HYU13_00515 [Candidatus Woesearchaeota archaeon]|nr:hypothetical protein [Candidatus Woesearchaeota archaeon]
MIGRKVSRVPVNSQLEGMLTDTQSLYLTDPNLWQRSVEGRSPILVVSSNDVSQTSPLGAPLLALGPAVLYGVLGSPAPVSADDAASAARKIFFGPGGNSPVAENVEDLKDNQYALGNFKLILTPQSSRFIGGEAVSSQFPGWADAQPPEADNPSWEPAAVQQSASAASSILMPEMPRFILPSQYSGNQSQIALVGGEGSSKGTKRYAVNLGTIVTWNRLDDANRDLRNIPNEIASELALFGITASNFPKVKDWNDKLKVSFGGEFQLKLFDLGNGQVWFDTGYTGSVGSVKTDGSFTMSTVHPLLGPIVDPNAHLGIENKYTVHQFSFFPRYEVPIGSKGLVVNIEGGPLLGYLNSELDVGVKSDVFGIDRKVDASGSNWDWGVVVGGGFAYAIPLGPKGIFADGVVTPALQLKHTWLRHSIGMEGTDSATGKFRRDADSTLDGFGVNFNITYNGNHAYLFPVLGIPILVGKGVKAIFNKD